MGNRATSVTGLNAPSDPWVKILRTSFHSTLTELSIPNGDTLSDLGKSSRFQRILQGQGMSELKMLFKTDIMDLMKYQISDFKALNIEHEFSKGSRRTRHEIWPLSGGTDISSSSELPCDNQKYGWSHELETPSSINCPSAKSPDAT